MKLVDLIERFMLYPVRHAKGKNWFIRVITVPVQSITFLVCIPILLIVFVLSLMWESME